MKSTVLYLLLPLILLGVSCAGDEGLPAADGAFSVGLRLEGFAYPGAPLEPTRNPAVPTKLFDGALTRAQELAVNDLWFFEFDGDHVETAHCRNMGHLSAANLSNLRNVYLPGVQPSSTTRTLYLAANLNAIISAYIASGTIRSGVQGITLGELQSLSFPWDNYRSETGTDFFLPMTGSLAIPPSSSGAHRIASLTRRVARINIMILGLDPWEHFSLKDLQIKNVPLHSSFSQEKKETYPLPEPTEFKDLKGEQHSLSVYIPENKRLEHDALQTSLFLRGILSDGSQLKQEIPISVTPHEIRANNEYYIELVPPVVSEPPTNLSIRGTANCYIINRSATHYFFNAQVQGNGVPTPEGSYRPNRAMKGKKAVIVWSMGGDRREGVEGVVSQLSYDEEYRTISFRSANSPANGNALIALLDEKDNILWSWHIWKVDYNPYVTSDPTAMQKVIGYDEYMLSKGETQTPIPLRMMKFNLGSLSTLLSGETVTDAGDLGLFYQWGRKDPFPGATGWGTKRKESFISSNEYAWQDGIGSTSPKASLFKGELGEAITYVTQHPTHFIAGSLLDGYVWVKGCPSDLWGNPNNSKQTPNPAFGYKTCLDPCPPGWRVPPQDTLEKVSEEKIDDKLHGLFLQVDDTGTRSWYTKGGYRNSADNGAIKQCGNKGFYWTSTSTPNSYKSDYFHFYNPSIADLDYPGSQAHGYMVRCCVE
ncbi:MAG: hypothetical protein LBN24_03055 [Mediterranea sp.]|nr:hypothetical protein [Mediterranea sp.]